MEAALLYCGCFVAIAILYAGWCINNGLRAIATALTAFSTKGAGDE